MQTSSLEERTTTLSPGEAAARLGLQESTLRNWRYRGQGPKYVRLGNRIRYRVSDLDEYLDRQTRASTSDPGPSA